MSFKHGTITKSNQICEIKLDSSYHTGFRVIGFGGNEERDLLGAT